MKERGEVKTKKGRQYCFTLYMMTAAPKMMVNMK
jgi:hypothetical protein